MSPGSPIDDMRGNGVRRDGMRGWLASSFAVHALILTLMIFGLPFFHPKPRDLPPMISVELVEMGKETTTHKISPVNKVVKQPEVEKPAPPTPPPPESKPTPPQPQPEPQPEPQPRPDPTPAPKLQAVDNSVPELKAPDTVIKPTFKAAPKLADVDVKVPDLPVPPKADFKKVPPKPPAESFDSVLKNLTKAVPQKPTDQPPVPQAKTPPKPVTGAQAPIAANLTVSENDAVTQQLNQCMNWPAADKDLKGLVVELDIVVNPDRTVQSARIVDQGRMGDPTFAAAARAAMRALRVAQCTPLNLPPDKYQAWQEMTVNFTPPKELVGQ
jgi:outer membrane biosynthesis protein TonB